MTVAYHETDDSWGRGGLSHSTSYNRTRPHKMKPRESSLNWLRRHHSLVRHGIISTPSSFHGTLYHVVSIPPLPLAPPTEQYSLSPGSFLYVRPHDLWQWPWQLLISFQSLKTSWVFVGNLALEGRRTSAKEYRNNSINLTFLSKRNHT